MALMGFRIHLTFNNSIFIENFGVAVRFPLGFAIAGLLLFEVELMITWLC